MKWTRLVIAFAFPLTAFQYLCAQSRPVSSEDILKTAHRLWEAADEADTVAEDAIRYCQAMKSKVTVADLERAISEHLARPGLSPKNWISASDMWRVADIADTLEFDMGLSAMGCALDSKEDDRARRTASAALKSYSALANAKADFEKLARQQTQWQEEQQSLLKEQ